MRHQRILVTGASGAMGAEVVRRLTHEGHSVVATVHRARSLVLNSGRPVKMDREFTPGDARPGEVQWVDFRLTEPHLGMSESRYKELGRAVDLVVHAAAITDFGRPREIYQEINVRGAQRVLDFAADAGVPVLHVSTAYVCGERAGVVKEDDLALGQRFGNPYEESKFQAEELVKSSGLPAVIVRPSIIVGTERTGQTREFRHLFPVLKIMTTGRLRTMPGKYGALLDLVPTDYVAEVITASVGRFTELAGRTLHAVNGEPLSFRQLSDELAAYPQFLMPRFVPSANFDSTHLPRHQKPFYNQVISLYDTYFNRRVHFEDTLTREVMGSRRPPSSAVLLRRLLEHSLAVGYLGAKRTAPTALPMHTYGASAPLPEPSLSAVGGSR